MGQQRETDTILHQEEVEAVIDARIAANANDAVETALASLSDHGAIADLAAPSVGYVQAEAEAARGKINEILDVLRDAGLIPSA